MKHEKLTTDNRTRWKHIVRYFMVGCRFVIEKAADGFQGQTRDGGGPGKKRDRACKVLAERGACVLATDRSPRRAVARGPGDAGSARGPDRSGPPSTREFPGGRSDRGKPGGPDGARPARPGPVARTSRSGARWSWLHGSPAPASGHHGTNGKSTTTSLLGAMLEAAGFPTVVAGTSARRSARW